MTAGRTRSSPPQLLTDPSIDRVPRALTDENKFGRKLNHFIDNEDVMAK